MDLQKVGFVVSSEDRAYLCVFSHRFCTISSCVAVFVVSIAENHDFSFFRGAPPSSIFLSKSSILEHAKRTIVIV